MPYVRFFRHIVPLQITTGLLSLVVIFMLFIALKIDSPRLPPPGLNNNTNGTIITPPPRNNTNQTTSGTQETSTTSSEGNFLAYEQISISILVILGCVISLLAPYRLKPNYRFSMVWVICIAGLVTGISQFIMIGLRGGCSAAYYQAQESRCSIQLVVSTMDLLWVVMLLTEGVLNYQRSVDKDFQTRLREQEEEGSERWRWSVTSVVYNPDLELAQRQQREEEEEEEREAHAAKVTRGEEGEHETGEGSDVDGELEEGETGATGESSTGRRMRNPRRLVIQTPIEVEPLPKYKPKPARGQPRIHDLGNMPLPPSAPSTPPPPVSPLEPTSSSSLSPSPEGVLPSMSTTITISTGGMDSRVTAGTGTTGTETGTGIGSGAEGTIPSSFPPSYSA
ncbi:MAG: hypothetical protein JOS17DRAFT_795799 [Linnemannia elongata]|nr:MAG: hypothetical protein JOS17DRAFT_795799 [Linnemannia elongata]